MTPTSAPPEPLPLAERTRVLFPGAYAWLLTVGLPVLARGVRAGPRLAALLALAALVVSLLLVERRPDLGRGLGIFGFVGCSVLTWALLGADSSPVHLDRIRTALGTLGWVLYAFGWGRVESPARAPAELAPGAPLVARSRLHALGLPIVGFAVLAALVFEALAFRVDRAEHAVLAHATATACALLVLSAGSRLALAQGGKHELSSGGTRLNAVALRGAVLAVLVGVGLVWAALK
ncbi:MAG TPA: hypothetical protein VMI54_09090 [Polyangiaceae bacterium]|nr:hypothetical protein [Polyangiaceae bacterium]